MTKRHFVGTLTIVGVLGLTAYSIYLWRKQKKIDEGTITIDEAREIARGTEEEIDATEIREGFVTDDNIRVKLTDVYFNNGVAMVDRSHRENKVVLDSDDTIKVAMTPEEIDAKIREEEERQVEEEIKKEQEKYIAEPEAVWHEDEGAGKLRHDPNSDEALYQFHNMELAEWRPSDSVFQTMVHLYSIPFVPTNDGDANLFSKLVDHRSNFFGKSSKWNDKITFADVITYYARRADYDLEESYGFWIRHFISINNLDDMDDDELECVVADMVSHNYYNDGWDSWGLFGLCDNHMREAEEIARGYVENSVTFEIEFNVFMTHWGEE